MHHPVINDAVRVLERALERHAITPYDETTRTGRVRYVLLNVERRSAQVQLTLVWNAGSREQAEAEGSQALVKDLAQVLGFAVGPRPSRIRPRACAEPRVPMRHTCPSVVAGQKGGVEGK